ncbi:MAG: hypothetical protein JXM69_19505 [Anaerolineae bacterium]|nr:hypothetical protein [Anaerolineae bacterium]
MLIRSRGEISSLLFLFFLPGGNLTSGATTGVYMVWLRGYAPNAAGDSLNRVRQVTANDNPNHPYSQSYDYDAFGSLTQLNGETFSYNYSSPHISPHQAQNESGGLVFELPRSSWIMVIPSPATLTTSKIGWWK